MPAFAGALYNCAAIPLALLESELFGHVKIAFFVPKSEIADNKYDLSLNGYKEIVHEEVQYDPPKKILARLKKLESDIASDLEERESML